MDSIGYKVVGICGSLRKDSYNKIILKYMKDKAPLGMEIEILSIDDFPLFNEDIEEEGFPLSVKNVREKVRAADGIIFLSPEYNSSVSGVLKNALDWISRKDDGGYPFSKKPVLLGGATTGRLATARSQKELRAILNNINTFPMNKPELFIAEVEEKIINQEIVDEKIKEIINRMLNSFVKWIELIKEY